MFTLDCLMDPETKQLVLAGERFLCPQLNSGFASQRLPGAVFDRFPMRTGIEAPPIGTRSAPVIFRLHRAIVLDDSMNSGRWRDDSEPQPKVVKHSPYFPVQS